MAKGKRIVTVLLSLVITFSLMMQTGMTVKAGGSNTMREFRGGVAALLNPGVSNTTEIVNAQARQLDVEFVQKEEEDYTSFAMANVEDVLNVRDEAGEEGTVIGKIYKDCGGTVLDHRDGWTKLQSGNVVGWTSDEYILTGEEAYAYAKEVGRTIATVDSESIRVRKEPNAEAEIYGLLPKDEICEVIVSDEQEEETIKAEDGSEWICINYDGKKGYLQADYVTLTFTVDTGETLDEIKAREKAEKAAKSTVNYGQYTADADTTLLLAALITCEAGGEPYEGQVAVGAVVMNRVRSSAYPDTIHGVIYASGQFTPAMSGKLNRVLESGKIYESCMRAAEEALSGVSNVGDRTHFRTINGIEGMIIGNHVFY